MNHEDIGVSYRPVKGFDSGRSSAPIGVGCSVAGSDVGFRFCDLARCRSVTALVYQLLAQKIPCHLQRISAIERSPNLASIHVDSCLGNG